MKQNFIIKWKKQQKINESLINEQEQNIEKGTTEKDIASKQEIP